MINLMYLVLTALLALNVSNEILNAFKTLSVSIDKSNRSIDQKNTEVYNQILENEKAPGQAEKVRPFREKADEVVKRANAMVGILNDWKKRVIVEAGGYDKSEEGDSTLPARLDNIDATTFLLVEKKGGDTLKKQMTDLRAYLLNQVLPKDSAAISPLMPLRVVNPKANDHNPTGDWSIGNFEHMPAIAAMALFSKFQNDVRSSQSLVLNQLYEEAHLKDIKFDTITAIAVPKTSYALEGDKIEASILLAAFNKSNNPEVHGTGGGGTFKPVQNGVVPWETIAHGTGLQTVQGTITLKTGDGNIVRPWKFEYMVGTTGASMQLDKMNVFYIGVANPVTVAAAGYSVEDVSLDIPTADVRPDSNGRKGHYNIFVTKPGTVEVAINAKKKEGGIAKVGGMTIRVKRIPDPVIKVGGLTGGSMDAAKFRVQIAPAATLENFEFAARYQIVSFQFYMLPKGKDLVGPYTAANPTGTYFNSGSSGKDIKNAINQARAGDRVFIDEVKVIGPDGLKRSIPGVSLLLF
jgi:gliding motility-associated protein GldM